MSKSLDPGWSFSINPSRGHTRVHVALTVAGDTQDVFLTGRQARNIALHLLRVCENLDAAAQMNDFADLDLTGGQS